MEQGTPLKFYELLREKRREARLTLREFCRLAEEDPANFSRIERGLRTPPNDDVVSRYAKVLKLVGQELQDFMDLAAIFRRELPKDIPEEALAEKLPAMLRSIDRIRPSRRQLENAVEVTREVFKP